MNTKEVKEIYDRYVIPNYTRNPILLVKGSGVNIWDAEDKRYLDLFSGWAVSLLGHCHPNVVAAIQNQAAKLQHAPNIYYTEPQGLLAPRPMRQRSNLPVFITQIPADIR